MSGQLASPAPDPASTRSAPQPQPLPQEVNQLPPLAVVMDRTYNRWHRSFWWLGFWGYSLVVSGSFFLPWVDKKILSRHIAPFLFSLIMPVYFILCYYARVSHHMPSKPVGPYEKHGLELVCLSYSMIMHWSNPNLEDRINGVCLATGINMCAHSMFQLCRNPPNLDWWDFSLIEVMQVAVFICGVAGNNYAVVATFIVCLMVICYRFYYFSCPETSDVPVCIVQKFGSEKAC